MPVTTRVLNELATYFKKREIPTIMGGIHASFLPKEALKYVDTVVRQDVEGVWPNSYKRF